MAYQPSLIVRILLFPLYWAVVFGVTLGPMTLLYVHAHPLAAIIYGVVIFALSFPLERMIEGWGGLG